jgi:hypothetical protein
MNYWLDLFTGTTWDEFRKSGASTSGFSGRMRKNVERIAVGDVLLCYLTGVMHWVGALEVQGRSQDKRRIWKEAEFSGKGGGKAPSYAFPGERRPNGGY